MKKVKLTELPLYESLKGLYTIGVDKDNRSVHVPLEFIENKTNDAVSNAAAATKLAAAATKEATKETERSKNVTEYCTQATKKAISATENCFSARDEATKEATKAAAATKEATKATNNANEAAKEAINAGAKVIKDSAATIDEVKKAVNADILKNDEAANNAIKATEKAKQVTAEVKDSLARLIPTGMNVVAPKHLTLGNKTPNYIQVRLIPENTIHNVIYISDNRAVDIDLDGRITVVAKGTSRVHVIPTCNTQMAQTISISVTDPTMRMCNSHEQMRFTSTGAIRFN